MKPRRGVHALVHVGFLRVHVAVDVDDADRTVNIRRDAAHVGVAD